MYVLQIKINLFKSILALQKKRNSFVIKFRKQPILGIP